MTATTLILSLLLGIGLAASSGLNTFIPLLALTIAARFGVIALNAKFAWLASDAALIILIIATVLEVIGDKFPAVDHALDSIGTFVRPIAGALAAASVLSHNDPAVAATLGIIVGAPASLAFHAVKATARVASTTTTLGVANPILSLIEDVISFVMSVIAIVAPIVVPVVLLLFGWLAWRFIARWRGPSAPPRVSAD